MPWALYFFPYEKCQQQAGAGQAVRAGRESHTPGWGRACSKTSCISQCAHGCRHRQGTWLVCVRGWGQTDTHRALFFMWMTRFLCKLFFFLIFLKISSTSSREEKIICTVRLSHSLLHTRLLWSCLARELCLYISLPEHTACSIQRATEINISVRFPSHYLK